MIATQAALIFGFVVASLFAVQISVPVKNSPSI